MSEKDVLQRFIFEKASVRGEIVHLDESYRTIMQQHKYPLLIQKILGEMLVAATLLSASIKFRGRITVQFQGKDKLKLLLAQCNHDLEVRALAQWREDIAPEELVQQMKGGMLAIIMDPESASANRYQGVVEWRGNSLAESIENYFEKSEQVPTRLWLAVNETKAAGLLIQVMPRESVRLGKDTFDDKDWEHLSHLSSTITADELLSLENEVILRRLYAMEDVRVFQPKNIAFHCSCSVERSENALRLLGPEEVEAELRDKQVIIVTCEFCSREYSFDRVDVARIFKQGQSGSSSQMH